MASAALSDHHPTPDEITALGWDVFPADWLTRPRGGDSLAIWLFALYQLRGDHAQARQWLDQIQDEQTRRDLTRRDFFSSPPA